MNLNNEINKIITKLNNKEFKSVINTCENLIESNIENTIIYNLYGQAYQNLGLYAKSIPQFEKSIKLNKDNYYALNNLAISLKAIEEYKLSEKAYQKCLKVKPDYTIAIINYANLKEFLNEFEEAIDLYLLAIKFKSEFSEAYVFSKLSRLYLSIGNLNQARELALKILKKNPKDTNLYELFSEMADFKKDKKYLSDMEELYNSKNLSNNEIINLSFPLGQAYDKSKNYQKAFKFFERGNKLKRKQINYSSDNILRLSESIKKIFKNKELYQVRKKTSDKKIIFICGMPRSGTTLLEQIISSHKEVLSTGEDNYLSSYINKNYLKEFLLDKKKIIENIYSDENLFQDYVLSRFDKYKVKRKIYTDKSVQNFLWIGFIKIFFPESKIIFTDRNAKDVCLSIFKINFKNGFMNFAYDQKDIGNFYNIYLDLINFWKKIFKDDFLTIKYESLIDKPESEIKKMISFCGLQWDQNCLNHHQNKSVIKTASISQARRPIYKSSKNLNLNYTNYLGEMFDLLKN